MTYVEGIDDVTVTGSRSGYHALSALNIDTDCSNLQKLIQTCLSNGKYLVERLTTFLLPKEILYLPNQFNVIIPCPKRPSQFDAFLKRYGIMYVSPNKLCICILAPISRFLIDKFIFEYQFYMCKSQNNKKVIPSSCIKRILEPYEPYRTNVIRDSYIIFEKDEILLYSYLGVDEPWYCNNTGHLNAVDLNLCFNQMMYILIGEGIASGRIPFLKKWNQEDFFRFYWSDFVIAKISSTFKKPLQPLHVVDNLCGTCRLKKIRVFGSKHLWCELDLSLNPGYEPFPKPGSKSYSFSEMVLVIQNYKKGDSSRIEI